MNAPKIKMWLLWLAFVAGILITSLGIWQALGDSGLMAHGDVVKAKVVDIIPADAQHPTPIPILQWTGKDGGINRMTSPEAGSGLKAGDSVEVLYQPLNPAASRVRSLHAIPPNDYLSILAGIALFLLAAVRLRR